VGRIPVKVGEAAPPDAAAERHTAVSALCKLAGWIDQPDMITHGRLRHVVALAVGKVEQG